MKQTARIDGCFPPRGSGIAGRHEASASARWGHPWELPRRWDWQPGRVLLGQHQGRLIGPEDDRHVVTVAGTRAGKSQTVLIPNLQRYPGSVLVLDPKGELVRATAAHRRRMGQRVYVLDPFGEAGEATATHIRAEFRQGLNLSRAAGHAHGHPLPMAASCHSASASRDGAHTCASR